MARFVREIMNPELYSVKRDVRASDALDDATKRLSSAVSCAELGTWATPASPTQPAPST